MHSIWVPMGFQQVPYGLSKIANECIIDAITNRFLGFPSAFPNIVSNGCNKDDDWFLVHSWYRCHMDLNGAPPGHLHILYESQCITRTLNINVHVSSDESPIDSMWIPRHSMRIVLDFCMVSISSLLDSQMHSIWIPMLFALDFVAFLLRFPQRSYRMDAKWIRHAFR